MVTQVWNLAKMWKDTKVTLTLFSIWSTDYLKPKISETLALSFENHAEFGESLSILFCYGFTIWRSIKVSFQDAVEQLDVWVQKIVPVFGATKWRQILMDKIMAAILGLEASETLSAAVRISMALPTFKVLASLFWHNLIRFFRLNMSAIRRRLAVQVEPSSSWFV